MITIDEESVGLTREDVQIERVVKEGIAAGNEGELTVALDTGHRSGWSVELLFPKNLKN